MPTIVPSSAAAIDATQGSLSLVFTGDLPTPSKIAAADLPVGRRVLLFYQLSYGHSTSSAWGEVFLIYGRGGSGTSNQRGHGGGEGNDHGTPEAQRCSHIGGFAVIDCEGGKDLEFAFQPKSGQIWVKSTSPLVAIPLNQPGAELTENTDYWVAQEADPEQGGVADATTVDTAVLVKELEFTTSDPIGFYEVFAHTEITCNAVGGNRIAYVEVDGVQAKRSFVRDTEDTRDRQSYFYMKQYGLAAGTHTVRIYGSGQGSGTKSFLRSRIFVLRRSALEAASSTSLIQTSPVSAEYPAWTNMAVVNHTPATAGNHLVIASGHVYRTNAGTMLSRLYDETLGLALSEFCSDANVQAAGDQDRQTHLSFAIHDISGVSTIRWQVAAEAAFGTSGTFAADYDLMVLPLTLISVVVDYSDTINEGLTVSAESTSTTPTAIINEQLAMTEALPLEPAESSVSEGMGMIEIVSSQITGPVGEIPASHPRLWIYNNDRIPYWQAQAAGTTALWNQLVNSSGYGRFAWSDAAAYIASGNAQYLDAALERVDGWISTLLPLSVTTGGITESSWHSARQWMRDLALTYDWLYEELGPARRAYLEDTMLSILYILFHDDHDPVAMTLWVNADGDSTNVSTFGAMPGHNFFNNYLFCAAYGMVAMHSNRTTFTNRKNGATVAFSLPFNYTQTSIPSGAQASYSDLLTFVEDRFQYLMFPAWEQEPKRYWEGGGPPNGQAYGIGNRMFHAEMMAALKSAGIDYFGSHPYLSDMVKYQLHFEQPRKQAMVPFGEFAGTAPSGGLYQNVANYARRVMLALGDALRGTTLGEYCLWWTQNVVTALGSPNDDRSLDFLWMRTDLGPGINPETQLPTHYVARGPGVYGSRDAWGPNGVAVWMRAGPNDMNNEDKDSGHIVIWRSDGSGDTGISASVNGYLLCEPQSFQSKGGDEWHTSLHNFYMLYDTVTPLDPVSPPWPELYTFAIPEKPRMNRVSGTNVYSYVRMDATNLYWQTKSQAEGATRVRPITDVVQRDLVHIKDINAFVVYDRVRVLTTPVNYALPGCFARGYWHYPSIQTLVSGTGVTGVYRVAANTSYLYKQTIFGTGLVRAIGTSPMSNLLRTVHVETLDVDLQNVAGRMCTAFQATSNAVSSMVTTIAVNKDGPPAAATMEGVTLDYVPRTHVLFSAEDDGTTPGTIHYFVEKGSASDKHYVCDLVPGQTYAVVEGDAGGGYFEYTVSAQFDGPFVADEAGVLAFTVSAISLPTSFFSSVTDGLAMTEATEAFPVETINEALLFVEDILDSLTVPADSLVSETLAMTEAVQVDVADALNESMSMSEAVQSFPMTGAGESLSMTEEVLSVIGSPAPPPIPVPTPKPIIDKKATLGGGGIDKRVRF